MTPQVLTVLAGTSGIIGLLAVISYFYYSYRIREIESSERSIRQLVEGEGLFNSEQILQILREFKDDAARLEALKTFGNISNQTAEHVYSKIKNNVDLAHVDSQNAKTRRQLSLSTAGVFVVLALIALTYQLVPHSGPSGDGHPSPSATAMPSQSLSVAPSHAFSSPESRSPIELTPAPYSPDRLVLWIDPKPVPEVEKQILSNVGVKPIYWVSSMNEAIEALRNNNYKLVISNINQSDAITNYMDFLAKADRGYIPIILYTGSAPDKPDEAEEEAHRRGAFGMTRDPNTLVTLALRALTRN